MKFCIQQIIYFCLINYVLTFPNDLFDELWQTNQSEPKANNNAIESQPNIKVEPHEEQFDGRCRDESALKGIVKVEHEPSHYGAVKLEGTVKIKHEFEWMDEESSEFKEQLGNHIKKEDQDGQGPNTFDQKKIGDDDEYWEEDEDNSAPSADNFDQENFKKHLADQNESVNEQQNESSVCKKIESDQQKREIIQKFREIKDNYQKKSKYSRNEWVQIEMKISNVLGVSRSTIYRWTKALCLSREKFSELEKREILKQFDEIKSKCQKVNLKNLSKNELDEKIATKLGICRRTIYEWKREFGLSVRNKFSDASKIGILKKYAKIKGQNPKMTNAVIADMLNISTESLRNWKKQFQDEIKSH